MPITPSRAAALARADELLSTMTLPEKAMQMVGMMPMAFLGADGPNEASMGYILAQGIGHIAGAPIFGHRPARDIARNVNIIQRFLKENTRLGIPAIVHNEALNGAVLPLAPVFPTAIALAATWDPDAVKEMGTLIREHMRAAGIRQALSPVMDVSRDARWGRVHETYGEDPYLVSAFAIAYTQGLQGDDLAQAVMATAKHFLGYGAAEAGQNAGVTKVSERELYEVYARPFAAAIAEANLGSVMNSYSEYDGVPIVASAHILRDLLRTRLGFNGTVVADYAAVQNLVDVQSVARDAVEAGLLALQAGLDVELPTPYGYGPALIQAAAAGQVDMTLIDEAVRRVLADKYELGLFDDPYVPEDAIEVIATEPKSEELSLRLASESLTLLKNEGNVLPLPTTTKHLAIIGPHAADIDFNFPAYTYPASVNMMRAMMMGQGSNMAGIEAASDMIGGEVVAAMVAELGPLLMTPPDDLERADYGSVSLSDAVAALLPDTEIEVVATGVLDSEPTDFDAVRAAVAKADIVVLALGGRPGWFGNALTEGEGSDSANIDLPHNQDILVDIAADSGKPVAAVISTGRPFAINQVAERIPAILWAYYGGQRAAQSVAAALFGEINPGGKLPYSIPRHSGQAPIYSSQHNGNGYRRPAGNVNLNYLDMESTPLYGFGHGLSYTTFTYANLNAPESVGIEDKAITVQVDITNTGAIAGDEVAQLYFSTRATGVTRPAQELVGFKRVHLEAGETATVEFSVPVTNLGHLDLTGRFVIEPGSLGILVGSGSDDIRAQATLELTGDIRELGVTDRTYTSSAAVKR
ncbi:MAG: glycoside hydrolase family 3 C-terminal domain-containing protein [Propionibacteriaceae bacterium]|jgi:beta-glucosidase|nr:glycoside hydrolase family 3 C-terminal domain-containing protein [Propionibacteriaceae bacterium]